MAINDAIKSGRTGLLPEDYDAPDTDAVPDAAAEAMSARSMLRAAIHTLPQTDQDIILLKYDNDLTVAQIAAALALNEEAVKKRLQRARAKLRTILEEKGYE